MVVLRALLYALAVFVALGVIAMIVAAIMKLMYSAIHRNEAKAKPENKAENSTVSQ